MCHGEGEGRKCCRERCVVEMCCREGGCVMERERGRCVVERDVL